MGALNIILITFLMVQATVMCITIYLHRCQTHKGLEIHPLLSHPMRFWLWVSTGMTTKQWVAIHRKHHQVTDEQGDPHSPHIHGIWNILFRGLMIYRKAGSDANMMMSYGKGTPKDWIERRLYTPHPSLGFLLLLALDLFLFGWIGLLVFIIQYIWIPFWAAGIVNGMGHWVGYRNYNTDDKSKNFLPVGIFVGGEELHNNHHGDPANPKFSRRWFEIDTAWYVIKFFSYLKLIKIKEVV